MKTLVICGPTASGKTGFAVDMAEMLNGEIISADCMLVYKKLNIGTAKPTAEEMRNVPHHMIDIVEPTESFSVSDYADRALPLLASIRERGRLPVICGGTGFYIQSLLFERKLGGVPADATVREKYEAIAREKGKEYLHEILRSVDPESAEILHPNDQKRVVRALEIYALTGSKKSDQQDGFCRKTEYAAIAFDYPREVLYDRINRRVDDMLAAGLVEEVRALLDNGVQEGDQCMQGIGYKEVVKFLKNEISHSTMSDMIKQNTRNYAKRQITFFKKLPDIVWLQPNERDNAKKVTEMVL